MEGLQSLFVNRDEGFAPGFKDRTMRWGWGHTAWTGAALAAASLTLSPAFSAVSDLVKLRANHPVSLGKLGSIGSFTPATSDSRLADAYARIVARGGGRQFRFTPTNGSISGSRSITFAVRTDAGLRTLPERPAATGVTIAPVAYNLGFARGLSRFTLSEDVGRKPLEPITTEIGRAGGFSLPAGKQRLTTNVQVDTGRGAGAAPATLASGDKPYSLDVASSYRLTRNLDVMAGVRYKAQASRLAPLTDEQQDSQAVYVGTIFKF